MKKTFLFLLLGVAIYLPAQAQTSKSTTAANAVLAPISASHRQAAESLLALIYPPGAFDKLVDQMLEVQLKQRPEAAAIEPEMRAFFSKYMSWNSLKPDMVEVYSRNFTEPELRDITKFYQTPSGRKMSTVLPQLMQAGMEIGQKRVQDHLPELQEAIKAKMEAEKK
ncbi:DUF2059 domain-containing protein [Hymenobacter negativus]|uniref:DUF2059 domain-containing protein n=1 Tax=Hymenobacter negativus TaxID=2795026 RepID=A0ABS0Q765_9BACT|nr:DUF2059 domain-containing protein [Hymenobacter negativus]MBH8558493.1 DUF2059 domain-containing protein [Hymenobacter negativus]